MKVKQNIALKFLKRMVQPSKGICKQKMSPKKIQPTFSNVKIAKKLYFKLKQLRLLQHLQNSKFFKARERMKIVVNPSICNQFTYVNPVLNRCRCLHVESSLQAKERLIAQEAQIKKVILSRISLLISFYSFSYFFSSSVSSYSAPISVIFLFISNLELFFSNLIFRRVRSRRMNLTVK